MTTLNLASENLVEPTRTFLTQQWSEVTGLVESYCGSSRFFYNPSDKSFSLRESGYLKNQSFTYDLSLCVIAYILMKDFDRAKRILSNLSTNFHIDKGGKIGLFNSYRVEQYANGYDILIMGIDGDRMHAGPNIWVGLAVYQYMQMTGDKTLYPLCLEIVKWAIHKLEHQILSNGQRGGISMGFGWGANWQKIYSTENNIDYYALLDIIENGFSDTNLKPIIIRSGLHLEELQREKKGVESWLVEKIYDAKLNLLYAGFNEHGLDKTKALDTTTFAILGIGPDKLSAMGIDPDKLIATAEKFFQIDASIAGQKIKGFDFTDAEGYGNKRSPVIWIEGTYQMIAAYQVMTVYHQTRQNEIRAKDYVEKAKEISESLESFIALTSPNKIPSYTSINPGEKEIFMTFKDEWEIQRSGSQGWVSAVASAVWRFMALQGFNPMTFDPSISKAEINL